MESRTSAVAGQIQSASRKTEGEKMIYFFIYVFFCILAMFFFIKVADESPIRDD